MRLGDYLNKYICEPCGVNGITFVSSYVTSPSLLAFLAISLFTYVLPIPLHTTGFILLDRPYLPTGSISLPTSAPDSQVLIFDGATIP